MQGGYGYVLALTRAIESWSLSVVHAEPDAFVYRGADLRYAAERSLFFELVHSTALRARFATHPDSLEIKVPPISLLRRMRYEAGNLSRLLRRPFVTARLREKPAFLFLAIHPKFVTFLNPIAEELGAKVAYLTVEDAVTESYLEKVGLPAVSVHQSFTPRLVPRGVLSNFVSLCRAFDQISAMMEKIRPSVIVAPEGNSPTYEVAHRAGLQHGVVTICMQHGAPAYTNPGFRNWSFADFLVWGSRFVEPFAKYNPQQKFTAIGTPATFGLHQQRTVEPIRRVGFFLQKAAENIPLAEWKAMLEFIRWLAASFPEIEVLVREHPTQPRLDDAELAHLGAPPNLRFMSPPQFGLSDVLSLCDVVVAGASTTLLEAIATGAIPFIFGTAFSPDFPKIATEGAAVTAPTLDVAKQAMTDLIGDANLRAGFRVQGDRLRPELFASVGREASARIGDFMNRVAANQTPEKK
jgi:hypothetical protein